MRPVRGSDSYACLFMNAELGRRCDGDGMLRDVRCLRIIFESIRHPNGDEREAALDNLNTTVPNSNVRYLDVVSIHRMNADFVCFETHVDQVWVEDQNELVADEGVCSALVPCLKAQAQLHDLRVLRT